MQVIAYGGKAMDIWWQKEGAAISRLANVRVFALDSEQAVALTALANRNMQLQCTVQDGQAWLTDGPATAAIELRTLTGH